MFSNTIKQGTHQFLPTYLNILLSFPLENCFQPFKDRSVAHLALVRSLFAPVSDDGLDRRVNLLNVDESRATDLHVAGFVVDDVVVL